MCVCVFLTVLCHALISYHLRILSFTDSFALLIPSRMQFVVNFVVYRAPKTQNRTIFQNRVSFLAFCTALSSLPEVRFLPVL